MGQESLEKISIQKYLSEWEEGLMAEANKQYLNSHFKIGEGANKDKVEFYQLYLEIFCTDNCELTNWVWKKLNGFLEDPKINCNTGQVTSLRYQPVCNVTNIYNQQNAWNSIQW